MIRTQFVFKPVIRKALDVSTGHITQGDMQLLEEQVTSINPVVIVYSYEYGVFVYVPENTDYFKDVLDEVTTYGFSQNFINIFLAAHEFGCKYIQFDADGEIYETLEFMEW